MHSKKFILPFVIGFLIKDNHVLLIKRKKQPWLGKWNGAGGKIETGETPLQAIIREVEEETGYVIGSSQETRFAGIVTWDLGAKDEQMRGMYSYVIDLSTHEISFEERSTREGIVAWKPIDWVCDPKNNEVAGNIPYFLPAMLQTKLPCQYHCIFTGSVLSEFQIHLISKFDR